ncbi:hypothetical protein [Anoxynatronum sibiricum]|uniref:Uncharacterized protein n=1 Tax=Anoxynatronum sibiricum TaxID=210623 RepID=A0ABU9VXB2_9CLOT
MKAAKNANGAEIHGLSQGDENHSIGKPDVPSLESPANKKTTGNGR